MWKYLFAIVVSTAVISTSVYLYRHREEMLRPDVRKLGGTRIAFAIESGTPDEAYLTAMRRRFDPRGRLGVVVRTEGAEVEILVPQGPAHDDTVARVVRLAGRPGKFAFVPVANSVADEGVAKYVQATYIGKKSTPRDSPPPPPMSPLGGREFPVSTADAAPRRYRWVRLGESATAAFQLDPASLAGGNAAEKASVDHAAKNGSLLQPNANILVMTLVARLPDEARAAFFLLVRDDSDAQVIAASHVLRAEGDSERHEPNSIRLRLDSDGFQRMRAIQQQRDSIGAFSHGKVAKGVPIQLLALVIDDRVAALPAFALSQPPEVILEVGGSVEERDDLVALLRGTPTGVRLSAKPTRVETLEPKR